MQLVRCEQVAVAMCPQAGGSVASVAVSHQIDSTWPDGTGRDGDIIVVQVKGGGSGWPSGASALLSRAHEALHTGVNTGGRAVREGRFGPATTGRAIRIEVEIDDQSRVNWRGDTRTVASGLRGIAA